VDAPFGEEEDAALRGYAELRRYARVCVSVGDARRTIKSEAQVQRALCADARGDVFVTGVTSGGMGLISEYLHGTTKSVQILEEPYEWPDGGTSGVNIYANAQGSAILRR
jgi:hypothetical protein